LGTDPDVVDGKRDKDGEEHADDDDAEPELDL
jgi:hypothetical protein